MSQNDSGSTDEMCNAVTSSGSTCQNAATGDDGTCHIDSHTPDRVTDPVDGTNDVPSRDEIREACKTLGSAVLAASDDERPKAMPSGDDDTATAVMLIRKASLGASGYSGFFGPCAVADCDRGVNGFDADTCDHHDESDLGGSDDSPEGGDGDTITVTINGDEVTGTPEDIRALKGL